ncbi:MAG: 2,3-bisphosphoglycerate-independent phosphoglycerate mutase [Dethiobacteria bacterium]
MSCKNKPLVVLVILDGWGLTKNMEGNAVFLADTPNMDRFYRLYPSSRLFSSGQAVGLPEGQMGNSEVGHLNLGAGRIVWQDMVRISMAIEDGSFFHNKVLLKVMNEVMEQQSNLHLMGLLSDGGVHSHNTHLYALLDMAGKLGLTSVYIHAILDGRDVPPTSAAGYLQELEDKINELGFGNIASISGRYYSMDRDRRWERTKKAYYAYVYGDGPRSPNIDKALSMAYQRGETDEFVLPTIITGADSNPLALVESKDALLFYNFRADRARQISRSFVEKNFQNFDRGPCPPFPNFVCLTEYDPLFPAPVVFPPQYLNDTLGEVISRAGLKQLRVAETEKYAHVTYFFNGGREDPFPGEDRILVPSPGAATYDLVPEMSASRVTDEVLKAIGDGSYNFIVVNYANADMVGHTGKLDAAIKAVRAVDLQLGTIVEKVLEKEGAVIITADHGNAEKMLSEDQEPHTAHTKNDTPFLLITPQNKYKLYPQGSLADVAPTILQLLSLPVPQAMNGRSMLISCTEENYAINKI